MNTIKLYDDVDAINRLVLGDKAAFNCLFDNYAKKLFCFAHSLTHNKEDAEEIVQETFMKVWENHKSLRTDLSFNAYIITIAKNLIFNKAKRRVLEHALFEYYKYTFKYIDNDTEDAIEKNDMEVIKSALIERLPERRKQIIQLRNQGFNNDEVAQKLNISKSTVANQINQALKDLQKFIGNSVISIFLILCQI